MVQAMAGLRLGGWWVDQGPMWDEPYLETCCRSALHRLILSGGTGRPDGLKDGPCLVRLARDGCARARDDGRFEATEAGVARHSKEILRQHRMDEGAK
jgi:hypothetical protein